jgi:serine/threonine protein kinase
MDNYKVVQLLGKGAFARVTLAIHKLTGKYVAIKAINKAYIKDAHARKKVMQEVAIHKKMAHPNIIK